MWKMIDVDILIPAKWNYKLDNESVQKELKSYIQNRGLIQNLIVRQTSAGIELVNGHHRLKAIRELGIKQVMAYDLGKIDQDTAEKIALETNETRFKPDPLKLENLLKKFQNTGPKIEPTKIDIKPRKIEPVAQKSLDAMPEKSAIKEPRENNRTKVVLNLEPNVAAQFKDQLSRVKSAMFPNENVKDIADTIPVQAIAQLLAETDIKRFSAKKS